MRIQADTSSIDFVLFEEKITFEYPVLDRKYQLRFLSGNVRIFWKKRMER